MLKKDRLNDEIEYNKNPNDRLRESVLIYEEKAIKDITSKLNFIENKLNKLISMLTAHDYDTKRLLNERKK